MKPEYEQFRGNRRAPKTSATVRLPAPMKAEAELVASAEGDNLTGLLIEGLARVLEDRKKDPEFIASIQEVLTAQASDLQAQLDKTRTLLGSFSEAPTQS